VSSAIHNLIIVKEVSNTKLLDFLALIFREENLRIEDLLEFHLLTGGQTLVMQAQVVYTAILTRV
jgi:hypothetical protein